MTKARAVVFGVAIVALFVGASFGCLARSTSDISSLQSDNPDDVAPAFVGPRDVMVVTTDKSMYQPGEPVNITVTFPNGYSGMFRDGCTMYYTIVDSDGNVQYDLRRHMFWVMVITFWSVGPGYSRSFIWNQADDNNTPVGAPKWLRAVVVVPEWSYPISETAKFEINPMPVSCKVDLAPGWNQVTMPLLNYSWTAGSLGLESGSIVVGWDSSAQAYAGQYVAGISPEFLDFGLLAGTSYFIYSQQAQTISLLGCSPEVFSQYSMNLLVPLLGGWTCVGFNTLGPGPCASEISDLVKGANVRIVCMYDPASSSYRTFIPGLTPLALDFTVDPGQGCWLWLDGAGTMTYSS